MKELGLVGVRVSESEVGLVKVFFVGLELGLVEMFVCFSMCLVMSDVCVNDGLDNFFVCLLDW